ncbi:hypothetical protein LVJ94_40810 [Pendulispora rubella]|uniref:Lipoprotein n=1 Tax=Pendulispora rubella TaxID=2741070 RepID=A0ABZ2KX10_9BACT
MSTRFSFGALCLVIVASLATACAGSSGEVELEPAATDIEAELQTSDLSKEQAAIALKLLDDICGDTWCEGEYNWHFPKIVCRFAQTSCTVTFRVTTYDDPPKNYTRWCKVRELTRFEDLVQTAPNGYQSLNDAFYDKVSACISRIEDDLRTP